MIDADALRDALSDIRPDATGKMARAWRNRSNVTRWAWEACAAKLGDRQIASVLYAACSDLSPDGQFDPSTWTPVIWGSLSHLVEEYQTNRPDKALSRFEFELRRAD